VQRKVDGKSILHGMTTGETVDYVILMIIVYHSYCFISLHWN